MAESIPPEAQRLEPVLSTELDVSLATRTKQKCLDELFSLSRTSSRSKSSSCSIFVQIKYQIFLLTNQRNSTLVKDISPKKRIVIQMSLYVFFSCYFYTDAIR